MIDIIPDIHGQIDKLTNLLTKLGYAETHGAWRHMGDPFRQAVFLGDYIDRGANNKAVIELIRAMQLAGTAYAIMGNHELNAIHYHSKDPVTGQYLRKHTDANTKQHAAFLAEYPLGSKEAKDAIEWMCSLPLYMTLGDSRLVHACWNEEHIKLLDEHSDGGVLSRSQIMRAANKTDILHEAVEVTTKGPEHKLPAGYSFDDKNGSIRKRVRLKWWETKGKKWSDVAMSVPDPSELPQEDAPEDILSDAYPADAPNVFFGHYWMNGDVSQQSANALCLDYSAGRDGPLIAYTVSYWNQPMHLSNITGLTNEQEKLIMA